MECTITVVIPNWNGEATIANCLDAVFASKHDSFEVIVVDDGSDDSSVDIIRQYPCRLISFAQRRGAAAARNAGAALAQGKIIFFTDADCVLLTDTLLLVDKNYTCRGHGVVIGGTYTRKPYDPGFFSTFQSVFVHYSEVKNTENPDYVATHAMAISKMDFRRSGGFDDDFSLPIIEDVEYTHRLRRHGLQLRLDPKLQVRHIFNFSLLKSLENAFRKSKYWTIYSMGCQDIFKDSGCASYELKANSLLFAVMLVVLVLGVGSGDTELFSPLWALFPLICNLVVSRRLFALYFKTGGLQLVLPAALYYMLIYSVVVGLGGVSGVCTFFLKWQNRFVLSRARS